MVLILVLLYRKVDLTDVLHAISFKRETNRREKIAALGL